MRGENGKRKKGKSESKRENERGLSHTYPFFFKSNTEHDILGDKKKYHLPNCNPNPNTEKVLL